MKKHKRGLFLILTVALGFIQSFNAQAQKPFSYGVKAGLNMSYSTFEPSSYQKKGPKAGFQIGFTGEYALSKKLFLQSELAFTTKGVQYSGSETWIGSSNPPVTHWKNIIDELYVQVPIKLARKFRISNKTGMMINAGYYVAYAAGGNNKTKNSFEGVAREDEVLSVRTFGKTALKRFDDGISIGTGITFGVWTFGLNYEWGFKDISYKLPGSSDNYDYKNRNISFTIGHKL